MALGLFADEVADGYADAFRLSEDLREQATCVAFEIASHLAERDLPGRWDRIDGRSLGAWIMTGPPEDRQLFFKLASQMLAWLARTERVPVARVRSTLAGFAEAAASCPKSRAEIDLRVVRGPRHADRARGNPA